MSEKQTIERADAVFTELRQTIHGDGFEVFGIITQGPNVSLVVKERETKSIGLMNPLQMKQLTKEEIAETTAREDEQRRQDAAKRMETDGDTTH